MRPLPRTGAIPALLLSAACALGAPKEMRRPPVGDDLTVETMRGGSVDVVLKAYEGRNNPLSYEIVREPRHGQLSGFRQADVNRQGFASVVYTHGDDEESREDEFTFKARSVAGGVSSPIKVKMRIVDAPPRLAAPSRVEFSAFAGESDVRLIGLTNAGGAVLEGRLKLQKPFHVEGNGYFRLPRGKSTNIAVRFSPLSTDPVAQQKISPADADPGAQIVFVAQPKEPFAAEAGPVELRSDGSREGKIEVTNLSLFPLELSVVVQPEGGAEAPGKIPLEVGRAAGIPVRLGPEKKSGALELRVELQSPFYQRVFSLPVPAVPPKLELLTTKLDFRSKAEAELEVRNTGGVEGRLLLELSEDIKSLERATSFPVAPDATRRVRLQYEPKGETTAPSFVVADLGKDSKTNVALVLPESTPTPTPPEPPPVVIAPPETPSMPWQLNKDVKLDKGDGGQFRISWVSAMEGWTNAVLQVIDTSGARPYDPPSPNEGWWSAFKSWLFGRTEEAKKAVAQQREFFEDRLKVPGAAEETATESKKTESEWRGREIAASDLGNSALRWRIVAQRDNPDTEPVSEDFQPDPANIALAAVAPAPAATPEPPQTEIETPKPTGTVTRSFKKVPHAQSIKPKAWSPARDGATIVFEMPFDAQVRDYRFERMQRYFGPDPATGFARVTYEGEPFPKDSVKILERKTIEAEGAKLDEVTVLFTGFLPGAEVYWRAVPLGKEGTAGIPSESLHFWTLPPRPFPWTSVTLGACILALGAVLYLRWKSQRAMR